MGPDLSWINTLAEDGLHAHLYLFLDLLGLGRVRSTTVGTRGPLMLRMPVVLYGLKTTADIGRTRTFQTK